MRHVWRRIISLRNIWLLLGWSIWYFRKNDPFDSRRLFTTQCITVQSTEPEHVIPCELGNSPSFEFNRFQVCIKPDFVAIREFYYCNVVTFIHISVPCWVNVNSLLVDQFCRRTVPVCLIKIVWVVQRVQNLGQAARIWYFLKSRFFGRHSVKSQFLNFL